MKKTIMCILCCILACSSCKKSITINTNPPKEGQIIANHEIVNDFDKIPKQYISEVKKMMVFFPGESHSEAYREGMKLLQSKYPEFVCNVGSGEAITEKYLRVNEGDLVGEAEWFTWHAYSADARPAASIIIKNLITTNHYNGHPINVIGFAWCWDAFGEYSKFVKYRDILTGKGRILPDPVYGIYWRGTSTGGPDGIRPWGLDSADYAETGNRICADTYLKATEDYISYCKGMGYITKVVFTTGPADSYTGENGYQGYLKHQYIRNYVTEDSSRILFDYNDILCYDDNGNITTTTWKGHTYPVITAANLGDGSVGHISPEGAMRLAKAQWWMLARIAGWDGKVEDR
jgi:hypothetical protein